MNEIGITFEPWPKTPRLSSGGMTITEKIDGTNACVVISPSQPHPDLGFDVDPRDFGGLAWVFDPQREDIAYLVGAQSRKKLIFPGRSTDNAGFAGWVFEHADELVDLLGAGRHFGEWWGSGIQRGYGMEHNVFSLFNVQRWIQITGQWPGWSERAKAIHMSTVPLLYHGVLSDQAIQDSLYDLKTYGSTASVEWGVGFDRPEGIIIRHAGLGGNLKAFIENDCVPKSLVESALAEWEKKLLGGSTDG